MDTTKDNFRPCSQFASGHEAVIRTEKLTKRFGSFTAVDGISFSVAPGEIFGFLGANGAGKTTAMRMLCGLSKPTSGKGLVAGYDIARESEQVKRILSRSDIDLTAPAKRKCAYFVILDDQNSTMNFLSSLFFSFLFIRLTRLADSSPGGRCPVPVNSYPC